jgi:hypothetical protein
MDSQIFAHASPLMRFGPTLPERVAGVWDCSPRPPTAFLDRSAMGVTLLAAAELKFVLGFAVPPICRIKRTCSRRMSVIGVNRTLWVHRGIDAIDPKLTYVHSSDLA